MNILGLETATRTGGVAVVSEKGVLAEYTLNIEVAHAERLMSTVDRVLKDTGLTLSAIDGFGVSIGPGSLYRSPDWPRHRQRTGVHNGQAGRCGADA